jgi:hypothetical protein
MHFTSLQRWSAAAVFATVGTLQALSPALAAELRVDINNSGRPLREGQDPAFTPWSPANSWLHPGDRVAATFGDITVTFTRVGSAGTALQTGYWKSGVQNAVKNLKLTADGLKVADGDAGAQIEMRIAGLAEGPHSLLLYLNNWDDVAPVAPIDISVDGVRVFDDLPVTTRAPDNHLAATAYLKLLAQAGRDVVILLQAETGGVAKSRNIHVNGFEIDAPNPKAQANTPSPAHTDEHVDADTGALELSWGPAAHGAASHDVYFGTDATAVSAATRVSPEFKGNQTAARHPLTGIDPRLTYHWRIDEIAADGTVAKGPTWWFRPRRLAFPGAEGNGRFARGGRGGVVVHVTNLNDSGPGSLRDAIEGNYGPRTVIFDVSGLISLKSDLVITGAQNGITVAGQTAPGKGVCVRNQMFGLSGARDVICRFIRLRVGDLSGETQNATGMAGVDHVIMDHCSVSWGQDEGISTRSAKNFTLQRTLIAEALNIAGHKNYPPGSAHGYAASVGGDIASLHHNLLAHNEGRNWSLAGGLDPDGSYGGRLDIFNNVVYNWGHRTTDGGAREVNFVNNYYRPGPASKLFIALRPQYGGFPGKQQYYMAGNVMPGHFSETEQEKGRAVGIEKRGVLPEHSNPPYRPWVDQPFFPSHATIQTAHQAYKDVLSDVGCNQPLIDDLDRRVIGETLDGTHTYSGTGPFGGAPGLPNSQRDVGGWEDYGTETRAADWDTDRDGLPDWWETIHGNNPASAAGDFSDSNSDPDGDAYTALEDYLNWMARPHADCLAGTSLEIDLHALSRGYLKNQPRYTFTAPVNGGVALIDGRFARFTPATAKDALGGFTFTVTDSAGDSFTRTVGVRILAASPR